MQPILDTSQNRGCLLSVLEKHHRQQEQCALPGLRIHKHWQIIELSVFCEVLYLSDFQTFTFYRFTVWVCFFFPHKQHSQERFGNLIPRELLKKNVTENSHPSSTQMLSQLWFPVDGNSGFNLPDRVWGFYNVLCITSNISDPHFGGKLSSKQIAQVPLQCSSYFSLTQF